MIFVGGTGRSGTTILTRLLGRHSELYDFPKELRFITDPDGLVSLKCALVDQWSFYQADFAIERFRKLMETLESNSFGPYPTLAFEKIVGKDFYREWLASFLDEFVDFQMNSAWVARRTLVNNALLKLVGPQRARRFLPTSYYAGPQDEATFFKVIQDRLIAFLDRAAERNGATHCVDGTPANLIHADFIHRCLPEMKLIHIYRDPRDVLCSFTTKAWGGTPEQNMRWIADTLGRWQQVRDRLPDSAYLEIGFEDLIRAPQDTFETVFDFLGLEFEDEVLNVDLSRHHIGRWKDELPEALQRRFHEQYDYLLERYHYDQGT